MFVHAKQCLLSAACFLPTAGYTSHPQHNILKTQSRSSFQERPPIGSVELGLFKLTTKGKSDDKSIATNQWSPSSRWLSWPPHCDMKHTHTGRQKMTMRELISKWENQMYVECLQQSCIQNTVDYSLTQQANSDVHEGTSTLKVNEKQWESAWREGQSQ